ncbi:MAG: hypothetical protein BZY88_08140 [SAR202 cluster bacterium Io17-Chloro-G9]|nr:MAG: hypothetical protein BZY88_08140 [SAR202 cluster bacterium Io17-Chloro-G9]
MSLESRPDGDKYALSDLRVIDCSDDMPGAYCTKLLADFGAGVIKVEPPGMGDAIRGLGPFPVGAPDLDAGGIFIYLNTNKRSITLNLETPTGKDLFLELVAGADVVVESYPPGAMDRLGLSFEELERVRPGVILTSITPFGQSGPWRDYQATDIVESAVSGLSYVNGLPEREPLKAPGSQTYYHGGTCGFMGTMTAVCYRDVSGLGQHVDVSLMEAAASVFGVQILSAQHSGRSPGRRGAGNPAGLLPCKDGYVALNIRNELTWQHMWLFFGDPDMADDPRFSSVVERRRHGEELEAILAPTLARYTMEELLHGLGPLRILVGMNLEMDRLVADPHLQERGAFVESEHPVAGPVVIPGPPFRLSETPWSLRAPAPLLGQHNEEVYTQVLGYDTKDIAEWQAEGVV